LPRPPLPVVLALPGTAAVVPLPPGPVRS
jgi:hypothetical protein